MAHDLAVMMMRSHSQIHPKEAYLNSIGKDTIRKKAGKNKLTIERVMVKPGLESNMRMFQPSLKG